MKSRSLAFPFFSNSPHEWQVESISKVDEIILFSWLRQDVDCPLCKRNCFDRPTVRRYEDDLISTVDVPCVGILSDC